MRLSTRNQLRGTITEVELGTVMAVVKVTLDGGEIGRAQAVQAAASRAPCCRYPVSGRASSDASVASARSKRESTLGEVAVVAAAHAAAGCGLPSGVAAASHR